MRVQRRISSEMLARLLALTLILSSSQALAVPKGITPPTLRASSEPAPYPEHASGDAVVVLELLLAEDGSVVSVKVTSGEEPFAEVARVAAARFTFEPARRDGLPIRARISFAVRFLEPTRAPAPPTAPLEAGSQAASPSDPSAGARVSAGVPASQPTEVVVLGTERTEIGSIYVPREDARRVPGAFGDPFRVVEILPGVAPVLSGIPYFYVRGAPPGSVGYQIDDIPVPLLFSLYVIWFWRVRQTSEPEIRPHAV
jgi:hypothetical protein